MTAGDGVALAALGADCNIGLRAREVETELTAVPTSISLGSGISVDTSVDGEPADSDVVHCPGCRKFFLFERGCLEGAGADECVAVAIGFTRVRAVIEWGAESVEVGSGARGAVGVAAGVGIEAGGGSTATSSSGLGLRDWGAACRNGLGLASAQAVKKSRVAMGGMRDSLCSSRSTSDSDASLIGLSKENILQKGGGL